MLNGPSTEFNYVIVPIHKPQNNNNQNIISTDLLQIIPTPQIIVKEDQPPPPPPLTNQPQLNSQIIEEKLEDREVSSKVNNTPKSISLQNKSPNLTPSHVRVLNFSSLQKLNKTSPKTVIKTQSLHKTTLNRFEMSDDETENAIKKPILGNFEEDSSSLDCNQTVIENPITQTPHSKGVARKCVRVLSRSGSENGGDESSSKDDEKKNAAKLEWETQRKLTNKNFDQNLRMQQQQKQIKNKPKKTVKSIPIDEGLKTENGIDKEDVAEKIYYKYPTPKKKTKTPKKNLKTKKSEQIQPKDKSIEPVEEIIKIDPVIVEPVIEPIVETIIEQVVEPVIEPIIEQVIIPLITTEENKTESNLSIIEFNEPIGFETTFVGEPKLLELPCSLNVSTLLETPYKFDPTCFPNTPRFLVPQVQETPITKFMNNFKVQDCSSMKNSDIQTPIFPITPGANTTPPISPTSGCYNRPTDYSSSSSYYKPDETDLSGRSVRRDSDYEEIVEIVKKPELEKSPVKICRRKKSFFEEPEIIVEVPVIATTNLDLSNETFRTPAKEVHSDSTSSDSSDSCSSSSSSDSDSSPVKPIVKIPSPVEKPIVENNLINKKTNDFYEERNRQQTELEKKRLRIMKKIVAEPPKTSYLTKKQHILARKVPTKKIPFITPSKRKSTNPGKLIYLEEPPSIKPQRLKNVKKLEKVSIPTVSDNSDNAVQSDVLVDEHFTGPVNKDGEESLDLIQKHLDSKIIEPVIDERTKDFKNTDLLAELEETAIEDEKTENIKELDESSSDVTEEFEKWGFYDGKEIEMKRDLKFKCSEKEKPLDYTKTTKFMFDEEEYCRLGFSELINIFEVSPPVKRQYNRKPAEKISYSFPKNKNVTPNAKFNLKQK